METKPGIYTTEFWVTILTNIFALVNLTGIWDAIPNKWAAIILAVINAAYAISRGQAKQNVGADPTVPGNFKLLPRARDFRK